MQCTRWLSLGLCISRLLEQWDPLLKYFASQQKEPKSASKSQKTATSLSGVNSTQKPDLPMKQASKSAIKSQVSQPKEPKAATQSHKTAASSSAVSSTHKSDLKQKEASMSTAKSQ